MKKWLVMVVLVALVGAVYLVARNYKFMPGWLDPKFGTVTRGDIRVPITAAGLIHAHQVVEVKSMASGRIQSVPVVEGDFIHKGDKVVVLDPIDEQRTVDRADAEYRRANALLKQAEVAVERAGVAIETARNHVTELKATLDLQKFQLEKRQELAESGQLSAEEIKALSSQIAITEAQLASAEVAVRSAELAQQDAEAAVDSQQALADAAEATLNDAKKRLLETTVLAPSDAIVTNVLVRPGMLVQSATGSFVGGTLLMSVADVSEKKVVARLDEADYGRVLKVSPIDALPDMPELRAAAREDAAALAHRSGKVKITVDAFPDPNQVFEGLIERVEPQGKLNAGSSIIQFDVHVRITDPKRYLLPLGAQAQVEFTVESATQTLLVPAEAVKKEDDQVGVWVQAPPAEGSGEKYGKRFVPCRFGISNNEFTQIVTVLEDGALKEGDKVYTKLPPPPGENEPS
ncbi:MAG: biotin/lipoyl-binding protein [Planctomycetota bacterium]